ncbi:MAG: VWA domain-containing protein [Pseudomonadota bacterium]|nr:VWA domain-containing protein [Pseudomonadota bacterium]
MKHLFARIITYLFAILAFSMSSTAPAGQEPAGQEIVLLIDNSGSMRKNDPQSLTKQAVAQFVQSSPAGSRVALILFDKKVEVLAPLTPINETTRLDLLTLLDRIDFKGQLTNSGEALRRAIETLKQPGGPEGKKTVVFMSDGIIDTGNPARDLKAAETMRGELASAAVGADIRIFAIAFTDNADIQLMQDLAKTTDGRYFQPMQPGDLAGVFAEMSELFVAETATPDTETEAAAPIAETEQAQETPSPKEEAPVRDESPSAKAADAAIPDLPGEASSPEVPTLPEPLPEVPIREKTSPMTDTPLLAPPIPGWRAGWMPAVAVGTVGFTLLLSVMSVVLLYRLYRNPGRGATGLDRPEGAPRNRHGHVPRALLYCGQLSKESTEAPTDGVYDVTGGPTLIGRAPGPGGLVIPGKGISREHAVVEYRDYAYWVLDQGSANGTFVNNKRVERVQRLHHGDRVRFNETDFLFLMPGRKEADATVVVPLEQRAAQAAG